MKTLLAGMMLLLAFVPIASASIGGDCEGNVDVQCWYNGMHCQVYTGYGGNPPTSPHCADGPGHSPIWPHCPWYPWDPNPIDHIVYGAVCIVIGE